MRTTLSPRYLLVAAACIPLCGCLSFKPSGQLARYFVLSPAPAEAATNSAPVAVGVGIVKVPDYLFKNTIAVRESHNELAYLLNDLWAEPVNVGFQRTLAANLSTMVPAGPIRLSEWRAQEVKVAVYVTLEQFDVDDHGKGVLIAWWRVTSPTGDPLLKSGQFRATLSGPAPGLNPQGAIATLSSLVAQLSEEIAHAITAAAAGDK